MSIVIRERDALIALADEYMDRWHELRQCGRGDVAEHFSQAAGHLGEAIANLDHVLSVHGRECAERFPCPSDFGVVPFAAHASADYGDQE